MPTHINHSVFGILDAVVGVVAIIALPFAIPIIGKYLKTVTRSMIASRTMENEGRIGLTHQAKIVSALLMLSCYTSFAIIVCIWIVFGAALTWGGLKLAHVL